MGSDTQVRTMTTTHGIQHGGSRLITKVASSNGMAKLILKNWPNVKTVSDARQPVRIDVTDADRAKAKPQEMIECAFALAACRTLKADGACIGIKTSYLVFGAKAIRFSTPVSVAREVVTFDRHQDFATGVYRLSAVPPSQRLGVANSRKNGPRKKKRQQKARLIRHMTARVRSEAA